MDGISAENHKLLNKLKTKTNETGSIQASTRMMKELRVIYQSESYKSGEFEVELVNDSLYEWNVKIKTVDPDSELAKDLQKLKKQEGIDHILLSMKFSDNFPFMPPFVRVVYPVFCPGGFVKKGGAICMELLSPKGWVTLKCIFLANLQISDANSCNFLAVSKII